MAAAPQVAALRPVGVWSTRNEGAVQHAARVRHGDGADHASGLQRRRDVAALAQAGLTGADIDYVNAHGASTMADTIEVGTVERIVIAHDNPVVLSSIRSAIGYPIDQFRIIVSPS